MFMYQVAHYNHRQTRNASSFDSHDTDSLSYPILSQVFSRKTDHDDITILEQNPDSALLVLIDDRHQGLLVLARSFLLYPFSQRDVICPLELVLDGGKAGAIPVCADDSVDPVEKCQLRFPHLQRRRINAKRGGYCDVVYSRLGSTTITHIRSSLVPMPAMAACKYSTSLETP